MDKLQFLVTVSLICDRLERMIEQGEVTPNGIWYGGNLEDQTFFTNREIQDLKEVIKELKKRGL